MTKFNFTSDDSEVQRFTKADAKELRSQIVLYLALQTMAGNDIENAIMEMPGLDVFVAGFIDAMVALQRLEDFDVDSHAGIRLSFENAVRGLEVYNEFGFGGTSGYVCPKPDAELHEAIPGKQEFWFEDGELRYNFTPLTLRELRAELAAHPEGGQTLSLEKEGVVATPIDDDERKLTLETIDRLIKEQEKENDRFDFGTE